MIELRNLNKTFHTQDGALTALDDISLTVQDGDRTVTAFIDYEIPADAAGQQSGQNVSELVPYDIFLRWCDEKDAVTVFIQHVDEVVTSEWLRSVRLALYNPNQGNP